MIRYFNFLTKLQAVLVTPTILRLFTARLLSDNCRASTRLPEEIPNSFYVNISPLPISENRESFAGVPGIPVCIPRVNKTMIYLFLLEKSTTNFIFQLTFVATFIFCLQPFVFSLHEGLQFIPPAKFVC